MVESHWLVSDHKSLHGTTRRFHSNIVGLLIHSRCCTIALHAFPSLYLGQSYALLNPAKFAAQQCNIKTQTVKSARLPPKCIMRRALEPQSTRGEINPHLNHKLAFHPPLMIVKRVHHIAIIQHCSLRATTPSRQHRNSQRYSQQPHHYYITSQLVVRTIAQTANIVKQSILIALLYFKHIVLKAS